MILVVGGAGYVGSHVNKELARKKYDTIVFDNLIYGHREFVKSGEFILGDTGNIEQIRLVFREYPIKAVMHFAAFAYVGESIEDPQKYYINNVKNTLNLLQVMLENKVKYFIFSSSCTTYGNPIEDILTESHPQTPINPYGHSKLMVERILDDYSVAFNFKYLTLRYFNAAGADLESEIGEWHDPETHLIPLILDAAAGRREYIKIYGSDYKTKDGTCIRDYIHVTDIAQAHILAIEYLLNGGKSGTFNLANGRGFSVKEVIDEARRVTGKKIVAMEADRRPGDPPVLVGSSDKAMKILKWKPVHNSLTEIIGTAWKWHCKLRNKSLET